MKRYKILGFLAKLVVGSTLASRAFASPAQVSELQVPSGDAWAVVRKELELTEPDADLVRLDTWLRLEIGRRPVIDVVQASYKLPGVDVAAIDKFWMAHLQSAPNIQVLDAVLTVRSRREDVQSGSQQQYLEEWLYLAGSGRCYTNCGNSIENGGHGGPVGPGPKP